jgi:uncharacterized protein with gpF-like domain
MNYRQRKTYHKQVEAKRMAIEKKYLPKFVKLFKQQIGQFLSNAKQTDLQTAYSKLANDVFNINLLVLLQNLYAECISKIAYPIYTQLFKEQSREFARQKAFETGAIGSNEVFTAFVLEYLNQYGLTLINWIDKTTKDTILKIITDGVNNGLSTPQIADNIFNSGLASLSRATTIVRTESTRATNAGIMNAGRQQRFKVWKVWVSMGDDRERSFAKKDNYSHLILDNAQVEEFEPFRQIGLNGVEAVAMQPGDITSPADFTINCRCVIGFTSQRDANGKLIRK